MVDKPALHDRLAGKEYRPAGRLVPCHNDANAIRAYVALCYPHLSPVERVACGRGDGC